MGGVTSGRVGQQSSKEQKGRRIKRVDGKRDGKRERKTEKRKEQMMVGRNAEECFCKGTRAQKSHLLGIALLAGISLISQGLIRAGDYWRHEEQRAAIS